MQFHHISHKETSVELVCLIFIILGRQAPERSNHKQSRQQPAIPAWILPLHPRTQVWRCEHHFGTVKDGYSASEARRLGENVNAWRPVTSKQVAGLVGMSVENQFSTRKRNFSRAKGIWKCHGQFAISWTKKTGASFPFLFVQFIWINVA